MAQPFIQFIIRLAILTAVMAILAIGAFYLLSSEYVSPFIPYQIVFFTAVTLLFHLFLSNSKHKRTGQFSRNFMLITFFKMMLYLLIIVAYSLLNRGDAVNFIISFFILYLIYTTFEVIQITGAKAGKHKSS